MKEHVRAIAITAAVCIAALVGTYGVMHFVVRETPYGSCNRLTSSCRDVPLQTLELIAGYDWGNRARVVQSNAALSHSLLGAPVIVSGVIELRNTGDGISLGEGASAPAPSNGYVQSTDDGVHLLKRLGGTDVRVLRNREQLVVLRAETKSTSLIYVYSLLAR